MKPWHVLLPGSGVGRDDRDAHADLRYPDRQGLQMMKMILTAYKKAKMNPKYVIISAEYTWLKQKGLSQTKLI